MVVASQSQSSGPVPPPLGSLIDNGSLELVEILGYGGYGIVYRAIDTYSSHPTSYAVKCLPHSSKRSASRQRQLHIREITLHQLASAHPGVVTLHRVIEDYQYTWIVMDYCGDGDLFSQILHNRRYLGRNDLIKEVFLQLLDAVEYCHSLNIYHRDLKPENILCFDDGLRLAITDFGLATTDRMSTEFRTGSVYHMSPECQGGEFAPTKNYSPLFNDVWSLGIILLNLITGRNPWKSASADDCTFQAYLKDPKHFLPTVLPISDEVNMLLTRTLEVDWRRRITLREMRLAIKNINNFYSPDVLFEDSMARCPWEAGVNVSDRDDESEAASDEVEAVVAETQDFPEESEFNSRWSQESDTQMAYAREPSREKESWADEVSTFDPSCAVVSYTHSLSASSGPSSPLYTRREYDGLRTPSGPSSYSSLSRSSSIPSPPVTPGPDETLFGEAARRPQGLTLDTSRLQPHYLTDYAGSVTMVSAISSQMRTAMDPTNLDEYGAYSSFFFPESQKNSAVEPPEMGMIITPTRYQEDESEDEYEMDVASVYNRSHMDAYDAVVTPMSVRPESPVLGLNLGPRAETPAIASLSLYNWNTLPPAQVHAPSAERTPAFSFLALTSPSTPSTSQSAPSFSFSVAAAPSPPTEVTTLASSLFCTSQPVPVPAPKTPPSPYGRSRSRKSRLLNPMRLAFTRRSRSRSRSPTPPLPDSRHATVQQKQLEPACTRSGRHSRQAFSFSTHWTVSTSISPAHSQSNSRVPASSPTADGQALASGTGASTSVPGKSVRGGSEIRRRSTRQRLRSAKDWFSPGKLFAAVMPSP